MEKDENLIGFPLEGVEMGEDDCRLSLRLEMTDRFLVYSTTVPALLTSKDFLIAVGGLCTELINDHGFEEDPGTDN